MGGSNEQTAATDQTTEADKQQVGRSTKCRPLSPTEMQDMSDKCYAEDDDEEEGGQSELTLSGAGKGKKTHKRSASNVTLEEMEAMALDMRRAATAGASEFEGSSEEHSRVGFVEALSTTSPGYDWGIDAGTDTSSPAKSVDAHSSPAKSVDAPLTDSDVENMEPLFSD